MRSKRLREALCALFCMMTFREAQAMRETYTSTTLFVVPWGGAQDSFRVVMPSQPARADFVPPIKGPQFFDVGRAGNVYIGMNAQPPEIRKYSQSGQLLWRIQGGDRRKSVTDDFIPFEQRKFAEINSMCCDDEDNVYVAEFDTVGDKGDRLVRYAADGTFAGFVSLGLKDACQLRRHPGGGITFLAKMENDPRSPSLAYPALWRDGKAAHDPTVHRPQDAYGRQYAGRFEAGSRWAWDSATSKAKQINRAPRNTIVLVRQGVRTKERFWEMTKSDGKIVISYPAMIRAHDIIGSDLAGNLYVDMLLAEQGLSVYEKDRIVKVNPITEEIVADMIRYPPPMTLDLISYPPIVVPETGDLYDFLDLSDGLHVVKYSVVK